MRTLTQATRLAIMGEETTDVFLFLLALTHPELDTLYFVNDTRPCVSNGVTYMAFPFDLTLPDDREDQITSIRLTINNIDRRIVEAVRRVDTPAVFVLSLIRAAEPDVVIAGPFDCTLRNVSYNAQTVSGDITPMEPILNEPYPQHLFDPSHFPALFG
jgi:hypothetical protein